MTTDTLETFTAAARRAASQVREVTSAEEVAELLVGFADGWPVAVSPALVGGDIVAALTAAGAPMVVPDGEDAAAQVADAPVAVVTGELAVAETGSVLISEHLLAERVVTMLCRHLVQVVDHAAVLPSLDDAASWLADRAGVAGFASLMTGPSRTADIERSLSIGVQGPDEVTVLVRR